MRKILLTAPTFAAVNGNIAAAETLSNELGRAASRTRPTLWSGICHYARGFVLSYCSEDHEAAVASLSECIELTHAWASDVVYSHALNTFAREQLFAGRFNRPLIRFSWRSPMPTVWVTWRPTPPSWPTVIWRFGQLEQDEDAAFICRVNVGRRAIRGVEHTRRSHRLRRSRGTGNGDMQIGPGSRGVAPEAALLRLPMTCCDRPSRHGREAWFSLMADA